MLVKTSHHKH